MDDEAAGAGEAWFEAVITPHRSLGAVGLRRLIGLLMVLSATVSTGLVLIGAWPVIGFNVLEMGLALYLLRRNARERLTEERLVLWAGGVLIRRTGLKGVVTERRLAVGWLQAILEERPGRAPAVLLVERGRRVEVGRDLGAEERRDLAGALQGALHRLRHPVFENAQL